METGHIQKCVNANKMYFKAFNEKNLTALSNIYSNYVTLTDWTGQWITVDEVITENSNFFQNNFNLVVNNSVVAVDDNMSMVKTINDITIELNNESIDIIDEILFDKYGKIYSITATKK
jgi:orotate phosphoribosyltransferase-like protein